MKTSTYLLFVLCILGACRRADVIPPLKGSITVRVSNDSRTRGLGKNAFESRIATLTCYLFRNGILEEIGQPDADGVITFPGLNADNYKAVLIAGDVPQAGKGISYQAFVSGQFFLYAESNGYSSGFNMSGEQDLVLEAGETRDVDVSLGHCCSKISIKGISIFYGGILNEMGVTSIDVQMIYIMDAYSACHVNGMPVMASDWGFSGVESFNVWNGSYMEFTENDARYAATCAEYIENEVCAPFYICPTEGSDVPVSPYLVLETIAGFENGDSLTWYYRVCLGPSGRCVQANNEYSYSLLITGPGADSPDKDAPGSIIDDHVENGDSQHDYF